MQKTWKIVDANGCMKKTLRKYLVWITLLLLVVLLFFQVRWMVYSVRFQEKVFQNSVNLALNKTISALNKNQTVCNLMRQCMNCDSTRLEMQLSSNGVGDQLRTAINEELAAFNIHLNYDLFIIKNKQDTLLAKQFDEVIRKGVCYTQSLREVLQESGYELVVSFPGRTRFFLDSAGLMLLSSVLLILLIFISIIQLVRLYKSELQLAENIKELINNVTHEFKTPISSIALAANLIKKGRYGDNPEKVQEYAGLIFKENQKLQRQVESLLHLAAIERDEFEYHRRQTPVDVLVNDAVESVSMLIAEREGKVITELESADATVWVDPLHLTNAIVNLLSNAVKYSAGAPEITVRTYTRGRSVCIEVSDQGIGIPVKYQRYVFDKYYRVPTGDVHNIKGFGIGLSYVKNVVEAHQGRVEVHSEPGKGSTFTLIIPKSE